MHKDVALIIGIFRRSGLKFLSVQVCLFRAPRVSTFGHRFSAFKIRALFIMLEHRPFHTSASITKVHKVVASAPLENTTRSHKAKSQHSSKKRIIPSAIVSGKYYVKMIYRHPLLLVEPRLTSSPPKPLSQIICCTAKLSRAQSFRHSMKIPGENRYLSPRSKF